MKDDSTRYTAMLQESLLADGWENIFNHETFVRSSKLRRDRLEVLSAQNFGEASSDFVSEYLKFIEEFEPKTCYELPSTEGIFAALFNEVREAAQETGLAPIRSVELVTSTSINLTPFARPTSGVHQLFIGLGTALFCSYWAKVYSFMVIAISKTDSTLKKLNTPEELRRVISNYPNGLILACRLCLYYSMTGTLLGFGEVVQGKEYFAFRMTLLEAMEVFVLSHECAHFVAEERQLTFVDENGCESQIGLEYFCDLSGMQTSRQWATKHQNWLAFTGAGALVFLHSFALCRKSAEKLAELGLPVDTTLLRREEDTHPELFDRINTLIKMIIDRTCAEEKDATESFLREYDLICTTMNSSVLEVLTESLSKADE